MQRSRFYGGRSFLVGKNEHFSVNVEASQRCESLARVIKIIPTIAILSGYMHKNFRPNRPKIRGLSVIGLVEIGKKIENPLFDTLCRLRTPVSTPESKSAPKNTSRMSFWAYLY